MQRGEGVVQERADKSRRKERINRARPLSTHLSAIREHPSVPRVSQLAPRAALIFAREGEIRREVGRYEEARCRRRRESRKLTDSVTRVNKRFPSREVGCAPPVGLNRGVDRETDRRRTIGIVQHSPLSA